MDDTRFQIGEIVYFVRTNQRTIDWGVCQDYYCDGYGLSLMKYLTSVLSAAFRFKRDRHMRWTALEQL